MKTWGKESNEKKEIHIIGWVSSADSLPPAMEFPNPFDTNGNISGY